MSAETNISECVQQMNVGFDATEKQTFAGLKSVASKILAEAKRTIKDKKITASGQLWESGSVIVQGDTVDIGFTADHAPLVEYGRKAGTFKKSEMPSLKAWVRRKLRVKEKELDGVTFLVARKIKREGTKAQPFLMPAYEKVKAMIPEIMKKFVK